MANDNTLKELEQILKERKTYTIKQYKAKRYLDISNATLGDLADFVATLANDLKKQRILK